MGSNGSDSKREDSQAVQRYEYEWDGINPTSGIVEAVAAATGQDTTQLAPLYQELDPDALNALVTKPTAGDELITVSFTYTDRRITVRNDGVVRVGPEGNGHASGDD
jgi:hypothetical protein